MSAATGDRPAPGRGSTAGRVAAVVLRHVYLLRTSWPRIFELMYWPTMQMVLWGFISGFFADHSSYVAQAAGVLIGAVLLWDVLFRAHLGFSLSFVEEVWSRNLVNLAVSPLSAGEYLLALVVMSFLRTLISVLPAAGLAIVFYAYSIFSLGLPLIAFFTLLLVFGWAVGMVVSAIILRAGEGAIGVAWMVVFLLAPVSAIYYPVASLPAWLQPVAWMLPAAPVFEGMRAVVLEQTVRVDLLIHAAAADLVYLAIGAGVFLWSFHVARRRGLLLQVGE